MHKGLKIFLIVLACLIIVIGGLLIIITKESPQAVMAFSTNNKYISKQGSCYVSAHRSGGGIFPENTMLAFDSCVNSPDFKTDIFEFDLHITKDGELILLHDSTLDRTSNATEYFNKKDVLPSDYTYEELRVLNMGESFTDDNGNKPYQGLRDDKIPDELRVCKLDDVLSYLNQNGNYSYIIEIKDKKQKGYDAADKLYSTLKEMNLLDRAIVGTFNGEVTQYMDDKYPDLCRSAGIKEVLTFYFSALCNIKRDSSYFKFNVLQIPADQYVINLSTTAFINYAHEHDIAVQYWTINDKEKMIELNEKGADAIITDNPALAYSVVNASGSDKNT